MSGLEGAGAAAVGDHAIARSRMLSFRGKSARRDDAAPMHSVAHHCLDVAAASLALMPLFPPPAAVSRR